VAASSVIAGSALPRTALLRGHRFHVEDAMITALARRFVFLALGLLFLCNALPSASAQSSQSADEADLNHRVAQAFNVGRYAEALPLAQQLLASYERRLSPDDPELARMLYQVADIYRLLHRTDDAMALYRRALAIRERTLGPDDPYVGQVLSDMGLAVLDDGRYADAEPIFQRLIAIAEKLRKPGYIATALNNLAGVYARQGRFADAIPLGERALAEQKRAVKADDPELATELDNLGAYYHELGRDAEAEPMLLRAAAIKQKELQKLGPSRLSEGGLADALKPLAGLYRDRGRYAEAEKLYLQALDLDQKWVGPDHTSLITGLIELAVLYRREGKYAEAEAVYTRALAIGEGFSPGEREVARALNELTSVYVAQRRYLDALLLVRKSMSRGTATTDAALPALLGAEASRLITQDQALDDSLNVVQRAKENATGEAVKALNARLASGGGRLAELVRSDQDLAGESRALDARLLALLGAPAAQRDASAEQYVRNRLAVIAQQRDQLSQVFARDFPDYTALSRPTALTVSDVQGLLAGDEALIVTSLGAKSYVWAISRARVEWKELAVSADDVGKQVSVLRTQLDPDHPKPFDPGASFALYQKILGPVEDVLRGKKRLSFVLDGALTSLPPQLLVERDPAGKDLKVVDWLIRQHAVTVLPSVESLKVLRGKTATAAAQKPLIGFADPQFNPDAQRTAAGVVASVTASRGIQGTVANLAKIKTALQQLPDTADELKRVGASVKARPTDLFFGRDATETRVKQSALDQYRTVYFATHGLLAGDIHNFAKLNAEPALVLSLPLQPTTLDDGLLTASEVTQLKLNAEWVVLSACNTASGDKPGAEALSGLARAFFYAGGRSLLVSNWAVETESTVALMTGTFAAAADTKLSHAEALQKSMLAMIDNPQHADWADPKYWAPFVVVGEPVKPN
jgi:CHAT domain-containing protein/tetratricopeptide (TPR) repeat protein